MRCVFGCSPQFGGTPIPDYEPYLLGLVDAGTNSKMGLRTVIAEIFLIPLQRLHCRNLL